MAPVKFDDIQKVAGEVLNDDFQVSGHMLKTKQKAGSSTLSGQIDLFGDKACQTPAKLTWKIPGPFGLGQVNVDKLEMDKGGKYKLELSSDKLCPVVKMECRSDLADFNKVVVCGTYTGFKGALVKLETKPAKPMDFNGEVTVGCANATAGVKFSSALLSGGLPDVGLRYMKGPYFGAFLAKDKLSSYSAFCSYKATPEVKCAATGTYANKTPSFALAVACKGLYKVKVTSDQAVLCSLKHTAAKGLTGLVGAKYNVKKGDWSYGVQLTVE
mmetsp:Transcript_8188/g.23416  ORF Transcript_8188/g.23416 Transcript_8188/m.23416 type:complete len:271 (-) Transcript_8188:138-950(-)|eukprot:CAMPEP_0170278846 /NCGR_PEP_ID=MMETSP0116_2-20130129/39431_1 /TAXON_ID=400756 /ORGANISM="Durinskia baltica, Strain CSIRO CS-38" /LENGTH=270 /DNA_ID=CAMNT_0010530165 /DNA_START=46 /DNA_END=858 /DNA_ORIENTATION=+